MSHPSKARGPSLPQSNTSVMCPHQDNPQQTMKTNLSYPTEKTWGLSTATIMIKFIRPSRTTNLRTTTNVLREKIVKAIDFLANWLIRSNLERNQAWKDRKIIIKLQHLLKILTPNTTEWNKPQAEMKEVSSDSFLLRSKTMSPGPIKNYRWDKQLMSLRNKVRS